MPFCLDTDISKKIFAKGVKEYMEKMHPYIPKLYPDIEMVYETVKRQDYF